MLDAVTGALPAGEERAGQREMAEAVARAIADRRHLVVQAGTGTGKSLAYLVPAILSGRRVMVATATKALQDQLFGKDLPFLHEHADRPFSYALLKGRSNYVCLQRLDEVERALDGDAQLGFDGLAERAPGAELDLIAEWAAETTTGDRADLPFEPTPAAWSALSVSAMECPGANKCPNGDNCFAEQARWAADAADVVVVNLHLYGIDLASRGAILPEHDVVIIDEAHQVEDTVSATSGVEVGPGRLAALGRITRGILDDDELLANLDAAGTRLRVDLAAERGRRIRRMTGEPLADSLLLARQRVDAIIAALRKVPDNAPGDAPARKLRAMGAAGHLVADIDMALEQAGPDVVWVEGSEEFPVLRVAPVDVREVLQATLWGAGPDDGEPSKDEEGDEPEERAPRARTVILTSATIPLRLGQRLGLDAADFDELDVGSPFDYERNALLYCAAHLPDPRSAGYEEALHVELRDLIEAAGGRTLALFTSWRAMDAAVEALADQLPGPLLTQRDLPKPALVAAFTADHTASLFATMGFWQGIDVPGETLSLVTIDRLPFPRPDEPLLQARRELARAAAFSTVDLPRAATLLAQGAGRLIRNATDRGAVAVLDPRLATAGYRWELVRALPPFPRTKEKGEVLAFLRDLAAAED